MNRITLLWVVVVLTIIGLADSAYLAASALTSTPLLCDIKALSDCNLVAGSPYSRLFEIPLSVYGVAFYGAMLVLVAALFYRPNRVLTHALMGVSILGALASLYFLYLQIWVIQALCVYCIASAAVAFLLCGLISTYWKRLVPELPVVIP